MITLEKFEKKLVEKGINLVGHCLRINGILYYVKAHHDSGLRLWVNKVKHSDIGLERLTKAVWEVSGISGGSLVKHDFIIINIKFISASRRVRNEANRVFNRATAQGW